MGKEKSCKDHLQNVYPSKVEMCNHWGISIDTFNTRIGLGWPIEKALTTPVRRLRLRLNQDHLGNTFNSKAEMCKHWRISIDEFNKRVKAGWTLQEALETQVSKAKDHLGNTFKNVVDMCKYWDIGVGTYRNRINAGYSIEKALTTPSGKLRKCKDPNGTEFTSFKAMCKHYGVYSKTVQSRLDKGEQLSDALIRPSQTRGATDHRGNRFKSKREMLRHYGITEPTYSARKKLGWSLEEILTVPVANCTHSLNVLGIQYKSLGEAIRNIDSNIVKATIVSRFEQGIDFLAASICPNRIRISHIGLDGKVYYRISNHKDLITTRDIISEYRPDLLSRYDTWNPKDLYTVNRGEV